MQQVEYVQRKSTFAVLTPGCPVQHQFVLTRVYPSPLDNRVEKREGVVAHWSLVEEPLEVCVHGLVTLAQ